MKVLVISPHLDDAAWSCAGILERHDATVVTICAGVPPAGIEPTQFDQRAGFVDAQEAMMARREEDERAMAALGCKVHHLDYLDVAYATGQRLDTAVFVELQAARVRNEVVVGPLGLRHPDHQVIATAFRRGVLDLHLPAWVYEELPYAYAWPEYLAAALKLARVSETTITRRPGDKKEAAVAAYHSQIRGAHRDAIFAPERYHRMSGWMDV